MTKRICSEDGCAEPHYARGFCRSHWGYWRRNNGQPVVPRVARPPLAERLWARVDIGGPDDCWLWTGPTVRKGYGRMAGDDYRNRSTHRVSYELATGVDPGDMFVCHTCDNPPCVNPAHLFLGTHQDNLDDMVAKDRSCRGTRCATARLTEVEVLQIRALLHWGMRTVDVARLYGMSPSGVHAIKMRVSWRYLT